MALGGGTSLMSSITSSDEEENVIKVQKPVTPDIPVPGYTDEELDQLVLFIQRMTILFAMNHRDWNHEILDVIRNWLLKVDELMLTIFYDGNQLTASLTFPLVPINDLMYFLRTPHHIFTVDGFHDEVTFGNIHEDIDGSLLKVLSLVYTPIFYQYSEWNETVKSRLCSTLDKYLTILTGLHYKMAGMTVLFVPTVVQNLETESAAKDREFMKNLEEIAIQWASQIRLCLSDRQQLVPLDLICPVDEYEFWLYRYEILQGLYAQLKNEDLQRIIDVLRRAQSVYIKQIEELTAQCQIQMEEAKSNIQYLRLLVDPCNDLAESENPSKIPEKIPKIIHIFRYIWLKSKYYNTKELISGLFRDLSNQIVSYCREQVNIQKVLDGNSRFGIKMCDMSITCCSLYKEIYEKMSRSHSKRDQEVGWGLDEAMIFNHVNAFIERLHDLIDICESMIVFARLDETDKIPKPRLGGTRGCEFEFTFESIENKFIDELNRIKRESSEIILNVHNTQWYEDVIKYREMVQGLEEIVQRSISNIFLCVCNVEEGLEVLATLYFFSYRKSLREVYIRKTTEVWQMFSKEMESTSRKLQERAKFHESWIPKFASRVNSLRINLRRITWIKNRLVEAEWLPLVSHSFTALGEYERMKEESARNINKVFEDWTLSVGTDFMSKLDRVLLVRRKSKGNLLDTNIDISVIEICSEAKHFDKMGFQIPANINQLYVKYDSLMFVSSSVTTVCLDYNKILLVLKPEERQLFKALILVCDRKIAPGLVKLTWNGDLSDAYIAECGKTTAELQEFVNIYKRANLNIGRLCEKICDTPILKFTSTSVEELVVLEKGLQKFKERSIKKLLSFYDTIIELIVAVYKGFEKVLASMTLEWIKYVLRFDEMLASAFLITINNSMNNIYNAIHGEESFGPSPITKIDIDVVEQSVEYYPKLNDIGEFLLNIHNSVIEAMKVFPRLYQKFNLPVEQQLPSFYELVALNEDCQTTQLKINAEVEENENKLTEYMETWLLFKSIWSTDKDSYMKEYEMKESDADAKTFEFNINKYVEIGNDVSSQDTISIVHFMVVNSNKLKNTLLNNIDDWQIRHIALLLKIATQRITDVYNYINENIEAVLTVPRTIVALKKTQELYEQLVLEGPQKQREFQKIFDLFKILEIYDAPVPKETKNMVIYLDSDWNNYMKKLVDAEEMLGLSKDGFKAKLQTRAERFKNIVRRLQEDTQVKVPTSSKIPTKLALKFLSTLEERIQQMYIFENNLNLDLLFFNVNNADNITLRAVEKEIKTLVEIWELLYDWETSWDEWRVTNFWLINCDEIEDKIMETHKTISKFCKTLKDRNWEVLETKRKLIDNFRKTIPLITALRNPAMRERHWTKIKTVMNVYFEETAKDFTFNSAINLDFVRYADQVLDLSNAATMELNIENGIKNIVEVWETMSFEMQFYHDDIYRIKSVDDCFQMLEEHAVTISSMKSTRFVEPFIKTVDYWEKTLSYIMETLEQGLNVQRQWLYLENIFSGEDIKRQLPQEAKKFNAITSEWSVLTTKMYQGQTAFGATHFRPPSFLLNRLNLMDKNLEKIQRALEIYLETKRQVFPRFYFISNDDLLEILGNSKRPEIVSTYLKKLFDNLYKIELKKVIVKKVTWQATAMFADDGEMVEFAEPMYCDGPAEMWLQVVEFKMIQCLRFKLKLTKVSLRQLLSNRDKWVKLWPGQCCLTAGQIQWTADCTKSLMQCKMIDEKKPLKKLKKKQSKVLGKLSEMSRKELPRQLRLKVNSLITIEIHGRDVIERMYKNNCKDINHFEWFSQLRFYWDRETELCMIKQTNTEHTYGYEYTGNSGRLVITPLTDRCYITLTTAVHLHRGGSPKGPAGTGKTETVKDLGKAIGLWVIVTNCSDSIDFKSIGKNFSGLAQSGCWGCFDEFNRINIEVLSVVAQQIMSIMAALSAGLKRFVFEGEEINLKSTVGLFITMNPGYAGRTELPDNLKSMFRPISMIVPDNIIIAENLLFSDGFQNTRSLSRKVFTLYELAKQQLSKQYHYDFGLRSMVALLRYAGLKRRQLPDTNEEEIVYLAMKDMNVARLSANDLPLFYGIMSDIFPTVSVPVIDYKEFKVAIENELLLHNLQVFGNAVKKVIEVYETKNSRHSTMVIGDTGTSKSVTWQTLQGAYNRLKNMGIKGWEYVQVYPINPKALNEDELYGAYNLATAEWLDGVISSIMRTICSDESPVLKWILFDGPVDAVWIENMNSVMDDNKLLTLVNSERITMPPQVSLLFEVGDLAVASPATVSRCGMVYNDYNDWGWRPFVKSWKQTQKPPEYVVLLDDYFEYFVDKVLNYKRRHCKETVQCNELNLIMGLCKLLDCLATKESGISADNTEVLETMAQLWFMFSLVWSICAAVDESGRAKLDTYIRELISIFPVKDTIYDYYVDVDKQNYVSWEDKLNDEWKYDGMAPFYKIIVPTIDTVRYEYLVSHLLESGRPVMLVGGVGTGKSLTASSVTESVDRDKYSIFSINLSAQTTPAGLQEAIENKTEKRTKTVYVPIGGKNMICFMDDFNMPAKDTYGSQPPLELIRQWLDYNFWYNRRTQQRIYVKQTLLIAAMGPPGGGRQNISARTLSRFSVINITFPTEGTIMRIFGTMLKQRLNNFPLEIKSLYKKVTEATVHLFGCVILKMLPTPAKSHYLFNLRDISKIFQGLLRCHPDYQTTGLSLLRLWVHECFRVFSDRLIDDPDQQWFINQVNDTLAKYFDTTFINVCPSKTSPMFGDFMSNMGYYEDFTDVEKLRNFILAQQDEYNITPGMTRMDLVYFREAVEHVTRLVRVISQPRGHMLNIGIGGSGRQVLTKIAAFICELGIFKIEVTKKYKTSEFREDLKILYKLTGVKNKATVFIFTGEQVVSDSFLEILNNILSTGEANLFKTEEFEELKSDLEKNAKKNKIQLTTEAMYGFFLQTVRDNLHIVLCLSPIGENFRKFLRQYPALINATTTNWIRMWPQDALLEVANKCLSTCKLYIPVGLKKEELKDQNLMNATEIRLRLATSEVFSIIHSSVYKMCETMLQEIKRPNYVTPANYLELVIGFQEILEKKRLEVAADANKLRSGLSKIEETREKVFIMSEELEVGQEKVNVLKEECEKFIVEITAQTNEADEQKKEVAAKSEIISKEEVECKIMAAQAKKDLDLVMPMVDAAIQALDSLSKKDISEVKSYGRPPVKVEKVMEAVMILLDKAPNWETSKKMLGEQSFLNDLKNFDRDHVSDKTLKKISPYTKNPELEPEKVGLVSSACKSLMLWVMAIENYSLVFRIFAPKQALLNETMNSLKQKQDMLAEAQRNLAELNNKLAKLQAFYNEKTKALEGLENRAESLKVQLERAKILVESLAGEKDRWIDTVAHLDVDFSNLPGDCLLSTAFISYLGPFDTKYREQLMQLWQKQIEEKKIPHSDEIKVTQFLVDPVTFREWNIQGLPSDDFSIENGVIVSTGRRWPLLIDPQNQGNNWIKNLEKDNILVIDFGQPDYIRNLEKALYIGQAVLLQNISEWVDPSINPILSKSFTTQGGLKMIRFNDKYIQYNESFRFYITTKLSNPHYPPEISSKTTLVNFAIKESGLQAQLLGLIVRKEKPILEEQKDNLVLMIARNRKMLIDLDNEILRLLNESKGSLLENEELFVTLQKSKITSVAVKESLNIAEVTEIEIDAARQGYLPAALRSAILFFVLMDMAKIDPMYQFSLNAYILLFTQSIERSLKNYDLTERITNINDFHTYSVYKNTCRGLFETHKLLFSTHTCVKILESYGKINLIEYDFLLKGGIVLDRENQTPNPWPDWISEAAWDNITILDGVQGFHGIVESFEREQRAWQEWFFTTTPETQPLVGDWNNSLTEFQKMCFIRCLRPDRMSFCISAFITSVLGQRFIEPPVLDLRTALEESLPQTPLIFVLSPGVDPTAAIISLAEQSKMSKRLFSLSLGQGQAPIATKMLMQGVKEGNWVFLANCHLSLSWMPTLDKIIETMQSSNIHKQFRLWLSSSPHPDFPISILQTGIKMTTEPPRGIRANMKRLYQNISDEHFKELKDATKYKKLLFALCFFHTILLERKKFLQLGWNIVYSFNDSDYEVSDVLLKLYLTEYEDTPWGALKYLIAGVNYGGHVTDDWDRRLLITYINQFFNEDVITETKYKLSSLQTYYVPQDGDAQVYSDYIQLLPGFDKPEAFGQHPNADIASLITETRGVFQILLSIQVQQTSKVGESKEEKVLRLAVDIEAKVPAEIDYEQTSKVIGLNKTPMQVVLLQEIERYNALLRNIKLFIRDLQKGIKGLIVMSSELDDIFNAVNDGRVPAIWLKSYRSLKPLASWARDLIFRIDHFNDWAKTLIPPSLFWLSAYTFPTGFLTAVLQTSARATQTPIDELAWEFIVFVEDDRSVSKMIPESGVFVRGLYLEGAGWNRRNQCLMEPKPMELITAMPVIHFNPIELAKKRSRGVYQCPSYYFPERSGSFIIAVDLKAGSENPDFWIKRGTAILLSLAI